MLLKKSKSDYWAIDCTSAVKFGLYVVAVFPLNTVYNEISAHRDSTTTLKFYSDSLRII